MKQGRRAGRGPDRSGLTGISPGRMAVGVDGITTGSVGCGIIVEVTA